MDVPCLRLSGRPILIHELSSFQEQHKSTEICCHVCDAGSSGELDPGLYLLATYTLPIVAHPCQKAVGCLEEILGCTGKQQAMVLLLFLALPTAAVPKFCLDQEED